MNSEKALDLADEVAKVVLKSVHQSVISIVLHGSLAYGSYEPERSDIDLLVVSGEPLRPEEKQAIFARLPDLLASSPTAIDLRVASAATAAAPARLPTIDLEIAAHPAENDLRFVADNATDSDLLWEFAMCRTFGRTLHGRRADEVIGPVSREWLLDIADSELATWQRVHTTGGVGANVPLTACCIWRYAAESVFCSKHEAARWAAQRAPECNIILEALHFHEGRGVTVLDASTLTQLLSHARRAVEEASSS